MEPQLIKSMDLENGLTLEIWDASRKIAADRWQVKLIARMEIEVSDRWFDGKLQPPDAMEQMRAKLGRTRCYEYQTERNFVGQNEKQQVVDNMTDNLKTKIPYYSHPAFAARFLAKAFADQPDISHPR